MHTPSALLDLHGRTHRSLQKLLAHCATLGPEDVNRELPGFGYPSVRLQLHHVIGAEEYWIGVLRGSYRAEDDEADFPDIDALEAYRRRIAESTQSYLRSADPAELNTAREMLTWPDRKRLLVPAHVVLRTQTHIYQHQGQVAAQCRLLGRPIPTGLDFPLD